MLRNLERQVDNIDDAVVKVEVKRFCDIVERLLATAKGEKIYSLHEPDVHVFCKGKARNPYEYGCKGSVAVTFMECFIVGGMKAFAGAPYDGHTLTPALEQINEQTGISPKDVFADAG